MLGALANGDESGYPVTLPIYKQNFYANFSTSDRSFPPETCIMNGNDTPFEGCPATYSDFQKAVGVSCYWAPEIALKTDTSVTIHDQPLSLQILFRTASIYMSFVSR